MESLVADDPRDGPALAMLDVADVPPALLAVDLLAKEAFVRVHRAGTVQPGRYLILFGGDPEAVRRSMLRASSGAGEALRDAVLLADAEPRILPAITEGALRWPAPGDALGALQHESSPTMLRAVEAALKGAEVELVQLRVADGLGGRAVALVWGLDHDVEAAIEHAEEAAARGSGGRFVSRIVRNADAEVVRAFAGGTGFFRGWRG